MTTWRWRPSKTKQLIANLLGLRTIISLGRPIQHDISKKASSNIGALKQVEPFVSMHTEVTICKGLIEPRFYYCKAVWGGLCYRGAYLWNNLPENVRTHSKFSKSDDFEGTFTLGLLIMLPHGNHVKQLLELIHFLLLYEYFNCV